MTNFVAGLRHSPYLRDFFRIFFSKKFQNRFVFVNVRLADTIRIHFQNVSIGNKYHAHIIFNTYTSW